MRAFKTAVVLALLMNVISGCGDGAGLLECEQNSNCDFSSGGVCTSAGASHRWCAYPDPGCSSGFRFSDVKVGDGVSGQCTQAPADASLDIPHPSKATSCMTTAPTCGPDGNGDCCETLLVQGGSFYRSYDAAADSLSGLKSSPATIASFYLDRYEVTVGRFRAFVEGARGTQANPPLPGAGANPHVPGSGWQQQWNQYLSYGREDLLNNMKCAPRFGVTWTDSPGANENLPMMCLSWYDAFAFCAWDGGYLPSEAEWNYAAAGGSEQRAFPWSSPASSAVIQVENASYDCVGDGSLGCAFGDINRVGAKPQGNSRWGHSDLSGNVSEWTLDWDGPYITPCDDCANVNGPSDARAKRGGAFHNSASENRTGYRGLAASPTLREYENGVRCAR